LMTTVTERQTTTPTISLAKKHQLKPKNQPRKFWMTRRRNTFQSRWLKLSSHTPQHKNNINMNKNILLQLLKSSTIKSLLRLCNQSKLHMPLPHQKFKNQQNLTK